MEADTRGIAGLAYASSQRAREDELGGLHTHTHTHTHGFGLLGDDCSRLVEGSTANIAAVNQITRLFSTPAQYRGRLRCKAVTGTDCRSCEFDNTEENMFCSGGMDPLRESFVYYSCLLQL